MTIKNNKKSLLLVEVNEKTRNEFKSYCRSQDVSMKLGLSVLMDSAVRRNVPIKHRMSI